MSNFITVIKKDIWGHLGHIESTHARKNLNAPIKKIDNNLQEDLNKTVPNVPEPKTERQNKVIFTPDDYAAYASEICYVPQIDHKIVARACNSSYTSKKYHKNKKCNILTLSVIISYKNMLQMLQYCYNDIFYISIYNIYIYNNNLIMLQCYSI